MPPPGVCQAFNKATVVLEEDGGGGVAVKVLDQQRCATEFCTEGVQGYEMFVTRAFEWVRVHFMYVLVLSGVFGIGELSLFCLCCFLLRVSKSHMATDKKAQSRLDMAKAREEARVMHQYATQKEGRPAGGGGGTFEMETPGKFDSQIDSRDWEYAAPPRPRGRYASDADDYGEDPTETYANDLGGGGYYDDSLDDYEDSAAPAAPPRPGGGESSAKHPSLEPFKAAHSSRRFLVAS